MRTVHQDSPALRFLKKCRYFLWAFIDTPKNLSLQRSRAGDSFTLSEQLSIEDDGNDGAGNVIEEQ
jgi:hypothetical protein